jgi:hypothetical protein
MADPDAMLRVCQKKYKKNKQKIGVIKTWNLSTKFRIWHLHHYANHSYVIDLYIILGCVVDHMISCWVCPCYLDVFNYRLSFN